MLEAHIKNQNPKDEQRFTAEQESRKVEVTDFGPMTLASVACGRRVTNTDLIDAFRQRNGSNPAIIQKAEELLEATGITERRASWEITPTPEEIIERTSQIGADLVRAVIERQGWNSVDVLLDTSASLTPEIGKLVMKKAGLDPQTTASRPYRMACAGAIAAFVDTLADPNLEGKRVIVCALEPLSQHVKLSQCTKDDLSLPAIFGDDFAAIAFNTSDFEVIAPRTHVVYDGAPIRFYADYSMPSQDENPIDENSIPPHYTFGENGKGISSISPAGFFLKIQKPQNGMSSQMDGWKTFKFFVPETIKVLEDVIDRARLQGINAEQAVMHQPSKKVNEGFQHQAKKIESLKDLRIPAFLLGEIRRSNSSSATALVIWQHLAREGQLDPEKPFLVCAPGIGSAISAGVIVPKSL